MTGSLQTKNNIYYIVLNTYENGKRKQKWINTELPVKGNKTKAQKLLRETLKEYEEAEALRAQQEADRANIPFVDAIKLWYAEKTGDFEHPIDEVTKQASRIGKRREPCSARSPNSISRTISTRKQRMVDWTGKAVWHPEACGF